MNPATFLFFENQTKSQENNLSSPEQTSVFSIEDINQEQIDYFEELTISCDTCKESQEECLNRGKTITNLLNTGKSKIDQLWSEQKMFRPCIAKIILEQIEKGML